MTEVIDPELVIGIVGRIGVDTPRVSSWLAEILHSLHYEIHKIKITDFLSSKNFSIPLRDDTVANRYQSRIDLCNNLREVSKRQDFLVSYVIERIVSARTERHGGSPDVPSRRTAYVIDQIKRPEEAAALQKIYGQQFILVSAHIPLDEREHLLAGKISDSSPGVEKHHSKLGEARSLIERDEKESNNKFGQRVSDVFPLADVIIDAGSESESTTLLKRFFHALFGNFKISPTRAEFFQNIASNVALTSCDTARQVGAAIERRGDILSTGFNEAPKADGGTYWSEDGVDGRDIALGKDPNTIRKRQMVMEIAESLKSAGYISNQKILSESELLDGSDAPLKKSQIMDSLEYGRAVHAEMAAISSAARTGVRLKGSRLFCTTFPCHNCSKHIVASGVLEVQYLEPYAKSYADELYPDSIEIDQRKKIDGKISFKQFIGITPKRYKNIFSKNRMKDDKGNIVEWDPKSSQPLLEKLDQAHVAREIRFQKELFEEMNEEQKTYLGLTT